MAKIDFHKVERLFDSGMSEMEIEHLLYLAELSNSFGSGKTIEIDKTKEQIKNERVLLVVNTKREIKFLAAVRRDLIDKLGIDRSTARRLFEDPSQVSDEEAEQLEAIRDKVKGFRDEIRKSLMSADTEKEIDQKVKSSKYKRFNIRDEWLPL